MVDLNKIKDKIARQHGYKNWFHMVSSKLGPYIPFDEVVDKYTQAHTAGLQSDVEHNANIAIEAAKERDELKERVKELEALMQEFVDRVDKGEVRSVKTYAKFKEALKS